MAVTMEADTAEHEHLSDFCECDAIDNPSCPLGQGDVFEWTENRTDPWRTYGVVVTADCDIAHQKNAGVLSYVPLLTVTDYLAAFFLPKQAAKLLTRIDERLVALVRRLQSANLPAFTSPLRADVIVNWLDEVGSDALAEEIRASVTDREHLGKIAHTRTLLVRSLRSGDTRAYAGSLCAAREFLQRGSPDDIHKALSNEVHNHLKDLPGDALFIRALTKEHSSGFVAYLRFIRELSQSSVAIRPADLASGAEARRIGRLKSPYLYRLTQMLGSVFSSIGLPDEYEAARHEILAILQRDGHLSRSQ
jgi:hypothetical protein